ncbi:MAG: TraB/GumN family protein [Haloarculaceae archaeon]
MTDPAETVPDPPAPDGEGSVTVVGTAHVSEESVEEVRREITERRPDVVAVELDEGRYRQMQGETPEDIDARDLVRGRSIYQFIAYWMLSYVQTRLGERFDIEPGADMRAGIETAEELGLGLALVDRDIQTTVQRFWARLSGREKLSILGVLLSELGDPLVVGATIAGTFAFVAAFAVELVAGPLLVPSGAWLGVTLPVVSLLGGTGVFLADLALVGLVLTAVLAVPVMAALTMARRGMETTDEELAIEDLTDADVVSAMLEEFRRLSPGGAEALIDERDAFIAHRLVALRAAGYDVVAVVGAGHRAGIERYLEHPEELPPVESLVGRETGGRFSLYRLGAYAMTLGFLVFFVLLALGGASQAWLLQLFAAWFVVNGVFAGGLAKLAGARWPSALVGGAIAWLTSVNPLLAPGWYAGYVELRYLDVSVEDITRLNEILDDQEAPIREIYRRLREVPLFRLVLIVALTNVGSMIASFVVFPAVLPWLSAPIGGVGAIGGHLIDGAARGVDILWGLVP